MTRSAVLRFSLPSLLLAVALSCGVARAGSPNRPIDPNSLTDERVQKAIAAIVEELYARKHPDRFWEPEKIPPGDSIRQRGGYTAIAVLSLLYAGQSYQDPRLQDAVDYLASFGMEGTYAITMRTSVWARLPAKFKDKLAADTQWLLDGFSEKVGGWDYEQNATSSRKDNSIRQFGALALWEAAKRGHKIERRYWQRIEDALLELQLAEGGWNYTGEGAATGSMTAAGLATLFITQDLLHAAEGLKVGTAANAKPARYEHAIDLGLKWMQENFSATENPGKGTYLYYYLYGVERVGLASGYKTFGGHDWYREGAAELIRRLCTWNGDSQSFSVNITTAGDGRASKIRTDDLAFGLMFLSRGRVPVAINKLEFAGTWNNRPRDAANLTSWIRTATETDLAWQIVNISGDPASWLDAPVLYLASHEPLPFLKDQKIDVNAFVKEARDFLRKRAAGELPADAKPPTRPDIPALNAIKRHLDLGGVLFAAAEGGGKNFADSVEQMGLLMYPQYEWHALPDDHWAYSIHTPIKTRTPLRALSNGVRDLIILAPANDLPKSFQSNETKAPTAFQLATNIYFQASELNRPRPRLAVHSSFLDSGSTSTRSNAEPRSVTIARAVHEDNWKPEPAAMEAFAAWLKSARNIDAEIVDVPLQSIHIADPRPDLVIVNGIAAHTFTPAQLDAIKAFAAGGGTVLFETPGGRGEFTASAEKALEAAFSQAPQSINASRIITGEGLGGSGGGAANLSSIDYRPFAIQTFGTRETAPRLRGISIAGATQPQMLFSREDLSHGLLDHPCWGISGYTTNSARQLLANIVIAATSKQTAESR